MIKLGNSIAIFVNSGCVSVGHNGKYWSVEGDGSISASQTAPQPFIFEFRAHSKMAIKAPNGCYIRGEQNGIMSAKSKEFDRNKTVMWEY